MCIHNCPWATVMSICLLFFGGMSNCDRRVRVGIFYPTFDILEYLPILVTKAVNAGDGEVVIISYRSVDSVIFDRVRVDGCVLLEVEWVQVGLGKLVYGRLGILDFFVTSPSAFECGVDGDGFVVKVDVSYFDVFDIADVLVDGK